MRVLFSSDPLNSKHVDTEYEEEFLSAKKHGFATHLFSFEELVDFNNPVNAVKNIPFVEKQDTVLYRGWMLKPKQYESLYIAMSKRNLRLINTPEQYKYCHHLPESYELIKDATPRTEWLTIHEVEQNLSNLLRTFGDCPVIVKDFVKSRKHEWFESFYIPNASDVNHSLKVVQNFIKKQGDDLNEGVVIRAFVELDILSNHSITGMPLPKEFRIFFLNGEPLAIFNYWNDIDYGDTMPYLEPFLAIAETIKSNFFTMDIAKTKKGKWIIIELGDGQVSGLPENINPDTFYSHLNQNIQKQLP